MTTPTRNTHPFQPQIDALRKRTANQVPTQRWDDLRHSAHDRAFVIAGAQAADLLADFATAVEDYIAKGLTLDQFRGQFDAIVAKHGWQYNGPRNWRSRVIYETNLLTSYAAGRLSQLRDPDLQKLKPFWMYRHSDNVLNPRPLHVSWDKLTLPADDNWFKTHYPPNGWGCHCRVVAVSEAEARRNGGRFGPAPNDGQRADGTPIGIDRGWDYMPGDTTSGGLGKFVQQKAQTLPPPLAASFVASMPPAVLSAVPQTLDEFIAAGQQVVDAIISPHMAAGNASPRLAQEALLKALKAQRALGGVVATGTKPARVMVGEAADRYPKDWVEQSNATGTLTVSIIKGRASYSHSPLTGGGKLTMRNLDVAVHEFGHRLQHTVKGLDDWFQALHKRRTVGEKLESLRALTGIGYRWDEVTRKDRYLNPYTGKEYGSRGALEVLTMTFQSLLGTSMREFEDLVLGDRELANLAAGLLWYWKP